MKANKTITRYVPLEELKKLLHAEKVQLTEKGAFVTFYWEPDESRQMTKLEQEIINV